MIAAETESEYAELFACEAAKAGITTDELEAHLTLRNTPRGTFEQIRQQLGTFADVGVTRFYLQTGNKNLDEVGKLFDAIAI